MAGQLHRCDEAQINHLRRIFFATKANPRAIKGAARWLHFECAIGSPRELAPRFAEHVFAVNWSVTWVSDFLDESLEAKRRCFEAWSAFFALAGWSGDSPANREQALVALDTLLQKVKAAGAPAGDEPGGAVPPLTEEEREKFGLGSHIADESEDGRVPQDEEDRLRRIASVLNSCPALMSVVERLTVRGARRELLAIATVVAAAAARDPDQGIGLT